MFTLLMSTFSLKLAGNVVFAMSFLIPPRSFSVRMSAGRIMVLERGALSTLRALRRGGQFQRTLLAQTSVEGDSEWKKLRVSLMKRTIMQ